MLKPRICQVALYLPDRIIAALLCRRIRDQRLRSQFHLDLRECVAEVLLMPWKERSASRLFGNLSKNSIPDTLVKRISDSDRIHNRVSLYSHLNCIFNFLPAAGVISVSQQDNRSSRFIRSLRKNFIGRYPDRIPNSRRPRDSLTLVRDRRSACDHASANVARWRNKLDFVQCPAYASCASRKPKFQSRFTCKRQNRDLIFVWAQHGINKRAGRFLFHGKGPF